MGKNLEKILLVLILAIAVFTRFWRLSTPENFYFDEVYHAFTAREFLLGNQLAWEFSARPPEGFAYEWTHPPLAKEIMAVGMAIFGINAFGWRFFEATAGVGIIFMVYLLGKKIFNNAPIGLIAAVLLTFETLTFTQSRIGMNDIYFLFFILAAIYFLISEKYLISGIFFGLSFASKWTAVYFLLIAAFYFGWRFFAEKKKFNYLLLIISYLLLPILIYLVSYLPFFAQGRNFGNFWHLQQQMYWYHTRLEATHPYQSPWYTWPINLRPVYYFLENYDNHVAKIYALGNPAFFWGGLIALWFAIVLIFQKLDFRLLFLIVAYLAFFLPWAVSPRIMFLYHYLPSIPFLTLLLGFLLSKLWQNRLGKISTICFLLLAISLFIFFYPHVSAWPVTLGWDEKYYWLGSWR